jgi:hypothetical protein
MAWDTLVSGTVSGKEGIVKGSNPFETIEKDDKSSHVKAAKLAGCDAKIVQSEVSQKDVEVLNRGSPVGATREEEEEGKEAEG